MEPWSDPDGLAVAALGPELATALPRPAVTGSPPDPDVAWAASGAMALTGRPDGAPLCVPPPVVAAPAGLAALLAGATAALGRPVVVDGLALLGERAALAGLTRGGGTSCGGATRLLRAADGWMAVSLARPEDHEAVAAWLGDGEPETDAWATVEADLPARSTGELVERAGLLGLPVGDVGGAARVQPAVRALRWADGPGTRGRGEAPLVVDLSSLWAGPLCAHLLQQAGARVVKVESLGRPDGARAGPVAFFDLLHAGQESVAIELDRPEGIDALRRLLLAADVVVEASRPRALRQLGLEAGELVSLGRARAWVSITGHGRDDPLARVAFGDDAAAAAGLVVHDDDGPCFVADAMADPLAGLAAALAVTAALAAGGRWLLDVALTRSAGLAVPCGPPGPTGAPGRPRPDLVAAAPRARRPTGRAPALGEHTAAVLGELAPR